MNVVFVRSVLLLILLQYYLTSCVESSFLNKITRKGSSDDDDDDSDSDGSIVMTGPGVYTSGSNVDLTISGGGSSMTSSGGDIFSTSESNPQSVVVPAPPLLRAFPSMPSSTTMSPLTTTYPIFSTPTGMPLPQVQQQPSLPQRRSSSPVSEFIKKTSDRIFGRNKPSPSLQDLDPSKMSVPELFAALSSMPPSKFDKIADQLISESLGMGTFMAPPPGFLSGGITGGIGSMSGLTGGFGSMAAGSSLIPALPGSLLGGRGFLSTLSSTPTLPFNPRLPLQSAIVPSSNVKAPYSSNSGHMASSSNVRPMSLLPPFIPAASHAVPIVSPLPPSFRTVVFPVYVSKDTPLPAISKEASKLASESSPSQTTSLNAPLHRPPHLMFGSSSNTLDHIHQVMASSSSDSSESSSNNQPNLVATPISHGSSHPIDTLHQVVHSGYMHNVGSQLSQPFSFAEENVRPGFGSSSTTTTPRRPTSRYWPYPPPIFTAPHQISFIRGSQDFGNQGSASDTSSVGVTVVDPPPSFNSNDNSLQSSADSIELTKFNGKKSYPILDVSSPEPKIYNAPHDPVTILKVFAKAYEQTGPSGSAEVIGPGTKAHVTIIPDGPVNPISLPRTHQPSIRRELKVDDKKESSNIQPKVFPVFVQKDSSSRSDTRG